MAKGDFKKNIEGAKETMDELLFATRDFTDEVKKSAKEVFGIGTSANSATKAFRDISTSIQNMSANMDDIVKGNVTVKDLAKEQNKLSKSQAKFQVEYRQALGKTKLTQTQIKDILSGQLDYEDAILNDLDDMDSSLSGLLDKYHQQAKINKENGRIMADMAKRTKNIQKGVGLAGAAFSGLGGILKKAGLGDIGDKMGLDKAVSEGKKLSAELTDGGDNAATIGDKLRVAGKMATTIGKNLMKSFGPLAILTFIVKELTRAVKEVDKAAGSTAKNLGISYEQSLKLGTEYREMAKNAKGMLLAGEDIAEAQGKLNEKFQTGGKFSGDIAADYAHIQMRTNLSDKAMGFLVKKQIKGEKTIENQLKSLQKTVTQFNIQNKMTLNVNKVMEKIAKASKSIHLFTKGNVVELAKTTMLAQKFGAEMSTIEGISSSLLDFESSIQNELEAELLLGQDINLEKARQAALTGDTAKLTEELMNQEAILNAFATDNVLAQEAAAKAIGLNRDQLAEIVMSQKEQQALQNAFGNGITDINGAYDEYKEKLQPINDLIAAATTEKEKEALLEEKKRQEAEIFKELGNENLENQLNSLSAAEELEQIKKIERDNAKSIAASMLEQKQNFMDMLTTSIKFAKIMGTIVIAWKTYSIVSKGVLAIQKGINAWKNRAAIAEARQRALASGDLVKEIGTASMKAYAWLGPILGIAAAAGIAALGYSYMSDGVIGPGGETVVSGPKGTIQLDKQDSMIVGTNLGGKGGNRQENRQDNSEMLGLLKQIANKNTVIEMGGNEVGQGINTAEREIQ